LNKFPDTDKMPTKEDINQGFIDELDKNIARRKWSNLILASLIISFFIINK